MIADLKRMWRAVTIAFQILLFAFGAYYGVIMGVNAAC